MANLKATTLDMAIQHSNTVLNQLVNSTSQFNVYEYFFKGLIIGPPRTYKTRSIITLPKPVLVDNFDTEGFASLRDELDDPAKHQIFMNDMTGVDSLGRPRFDLIDPDCYTRWKTDLLERINAGVFKHFASYVIDSGSQLSMMVLHHFVQAAVRKRATSRVDGVQPDRSDHMRMMIEFNELLMKLIALPCHFVMTGHFKNEPLYGVSAKGEQFVRQVDQLLDFGGQATRAIALRGFSDIYHSTIADQVTGDTVRRLPAWKTQVQDTPCGGGSRFNALDKSGNLILHPLEPANYRSLFKRLGLAFEDKPHFTIPERAQPSNS